MNPLAWIKIGAVLAVVAGLYGAGWATRDAFCDAAEAKTALETEKKAHQATKNDLSAAKLGALAARAALETIEEAAGARDAKITELERTLADNPAIACRRLDADGLRRLLSIAPR